MVRTHDLLDCGGGTGQLVQTHDLLECAGGTDQTQIVAGLLDVSERKGLFHQLIH